jgi:uncharacterized protein
MKFEPKHFILLCAFISLHWNGVAQQQEQVSFDFSTVKEYRETKVDGQIINDYAGVFTPAQRKELFDLLYDYDRQTTRQIVVVTVDSISPYINIQRMAADLGNYWGVGSAEKDNGLVILLCKPCRQIALGTGKGTQLVLTDEVCQEVIDKTIIPEFKKGDYFAGIRAGIKELIEKWE